MIPVGQVPDLPFHIPNDPECARKWGLPTLSQGADNLGRTQFRPSPRGQSRLSPLSRPSENRAH
jgi:hypothetical protein